MPHSQGPPIIPTLSRINQIHRIDAYYIKIHSNISSNLRLDHPKGLFVYCIQIIMYLFKLHHHDIVSSMPKHSYECLSHILSSQN